jgi:putative SOS response-associated peptidase YedK
MCNDYERHIEWAAYEAALAEARLGITTDAGPHQLSAADDVRVGDMAPIVRAQGNVTELTTLRWGFAPARPGGAPVFNFKSESRSFAESKRCLIPASAFFEFTGTKSPKNKWRFSIPGNQVFAVAGLWREDAANGGAFTMLTTAPGPDIAPFHDRQIVVLPARDWASWLYLDRPETELLRPLPAGSLRVSLAREGREPPARDLLELSKTRS